MDMKQNGAVESWYQVQRHGYGTRPALVSQPLLGLADAEKKLVERQATEHDAGYSYKLVPCSAPEFPRRRFPRSKRAG